MPGQDMLNFNANKAGMGGIDKDKVSKVIAENTSANYSSFNAKQQERVNVKIAEIKKRLQCATPTEGVRAEKEMDCLAARLESTRDLSRHCVHIDMDAYFAAVEMRDEPRLRHVPMAVGSAAMLGTSNYLARKFGVRAAMPGFIAKKLCPELEIVPGNYEKYRKESRIFSAIFAEYDSDMSMGSLDEAYIDITEYLEQRIEPAKHVRRRFGGQCRCRLPLISESDVTDELKRTKEECTKCGRERLIYEDEVEFGTDRGEVVREIQFRVEQATGLTCSAGIACNFMLAKIGSDLNKPNGQYELANEYDDVMKFLVDLPIRKVSGIGRVSEAHLAACDIGTVGELLERRAVLRLAFSQLSQETLLRIALGLPGRPRTGDPRRKSVSVERTFTPTDCATELRAIVRQLCEELITEIGKMEVLGGRCVTLKIKLSTFDTLTRSMTLERAVCDFEALHSAAAEILGRELGQQIRLLGVRLSHLKFTDENSSDGNRKTVMDYFTAAKRPKLDDEVENDVIWDTPSSSTENVPSTSESQSNPTEASNSSDSRTNSPDTVNSDNYVCCPICSQRLSNNDILVNSHVDVCLNIGFLSKETAVKPVKIKPPNKGSITSYFKTV